MTNPFPTPSWLSDVMKLLFAQSIRSNSSYKTGVALIVSFTSQEGP